jgi:NAD(P)-dependent dehydrogenase (short-subunit alcohol dehydrogenase family)
MASHLITGCSRGLLLALAAHLASFSSSEVNLVFATARNLSPELEHVVQSSDGRVVSLQLDVTNESSIKHAVAQVEVKLDGRGLDALINNAGKMYYAPDGIVEM